MTAKSGATTAGATVMGPIAPLTACPRIYLNDFLARAGIDPSDVVVARHRPKEARLNKVMPWLVSDRPHLFALYQSVQDRWAASFMRRRYLASFLGVSPGAGVFAGFYEIGEAGPLSEQEYRSDAGYLELFDLGLSNTLRDGPTTRFVLSELPQWKPWIGRLVVDWPGKELSWVRLADRNAMPVRFISEESQFSKVMPHWTAIDISWAELQIIPTSWKARLAEWRGIYFIFDAERKAGYVGSACGKENLLGRWTEYRRTGHGGNVRLRQSDPQNLRFSILQVTSPDMLSNDVLALEASWKMRLHTREHGLNVC